MSIISNLTYQTLGRTGEEDHVLHFSESLTMPTLQITGNNKHVIVDSLINLVKLQDLTLDITLAFPQALLLLCFFL